MTLDEAIKHEEEVMTENLEKTKSRNASDPIAINCSECAEEHRQLAEWLKDYKRLLEQEPCEDAISRQAVLEGKVIHQSCDGIEIINGYAVPVEYIENLPPVTPQPKTGHWIVDGSVDCYLDKVRCHCSECGKKKEFSADYDHIKHKLSISYQYSEFIENYCSNCGAKMEKESNKIEKICCNCIHNKESEPTIENCATCHEQDNFTPKPKGE